MRQVWGKSKASEAEAVVTYREAFATKQMP